VEVLLSTRVENVKSRPIDVETSVRLGETVTAARASEGAELARIARTQQRTAMRVIQSPLLAGEPTLRPRLLQRRRPLLR
jgi:hypothetical protein